ncbi:MAG: hypothetical protein IT327_02715 [Anaerolineae bacterium]|nr:hypothetical protein [Anaerolineae bacterium]
MIAIRDALADKKVVVTAVIRQGDENTPRDSRDVVVTVGIPDERVVIKAGKFGQLHHLIDVAWSEYGEIVTANQTAVATTEPEEIGSAAPEATVSQSSSYYSDDDF